MKNLPVFIIWQRFLLTHPTYEGFGIPPLEAMAWGCPVIVSNTTSMPEACGEAALYVDPEKPMTINNQLIRLIKDETLQQQLIEKGLQHVCQFDWNATAHKHQDLFDKVLQTI